MDYKNSKIYMLEPICEYDEGDVYYGSTVSTLVKRLSNHKRPCNDCKSKLLFDKYGRDNIKIVLLEECPCDNISQLKAVEAKYQRENKCVNKNIAGRTRKEYYQDNREKISEYNKEHYQENREKVSEHNKEYYQDNREKLIEHQKEHYQVNREKIIEHQKEHYQVNREKILEKKKEHYQANREKLNEKQKEYKQVNREKINEYQKEYYYVNREKHREKITCECGRTVCRSEMTRHKKSKVHLENI